MPWASEFLEKCKRFGAGHRIESVEWFVQYQHRGMMCDGLRQANLLPHTLAIACNFPMRRLSKIDALDRLNCHRGGFAVRDAVQAETVEYKFPSRDTSREGIELSAVADAPEEFVCVRAE